MGHEHSKAHDKKSSSHERDSRDARRHAPAPAAQASHHHGGSSSGSSSGRTAAGTRSSRAGSDPSAHVLNDRVASRGRNLFCTLLDNRDEQAERKQADDRRSVAKMGHGYRIPRAFIDRFEWGELVGSGAYSYVQKAVDRRTGTRVAIKCIRKDPLDQELCDQIETEVALQSEVCKHENIVSVLEFVNTPSMYFIVMELLDGDLLRNIVTETRAGRYSERQAAETVRGLAAALAACHERGIAHLDIKPDNVLFDAHGTLKLADFGMAAKVPVYRDVGTPLFVAPEILLEGQCDTKADIFSLGVVAYILLCGFAPWVEARTLDDLSSAIKNCKWDFYSPYWDTISDDAKELLATMMDPDPRRRPTARQVINHKWIVHTASSSPLAHAIPRRIMAHSRHEFTKKASRVQALKGRDKAAVAKGSREALNMARTAPLTRRKAEEAAADASTAAADGVVVGAVMQSADLRSAASSAGTNVSGDGALNITPRIVSRSAGGDSHKSALRAAQASYKRRRGRGSGVTFSGTDVEVSNKGERTPRRTHFAEDAAPAAEDAGAGAGGSAGSGAQPHRMTAGDRAARAAQRNEDRRRRDSETRWERLKAASANLVAARVAELDNMHIAELEGVAA